MKMAIGICILIGSGLLSISFPYMLNHKENPEEDMYEYFERNIGIIVFGNGDDNEIPLLELKSKPSNYIGEGGTSIQWEVTKTRAEEELEVEFNILNETSTEFCIKLKNKGKYEEELIDKDISQVPINITSGIMDININNINLSSEEIEIEQCFTVTYPELKEGMQFRIGWESVLIDASSSLTTTAYGGNENFCIMNGVSGHDDLCHIAYIGGGSDLWYANATYDSINNRCLDDWGTNELFAGTVSFVNIVCAPDGTLTVSFLNGGDIDMYQSSTDGGSWGSITTVEDDVDIFLGPIAATVDSNSIIHWCGIDDDDDMIHVQSDNLNGGAVISSYDADYCDIASDSSDNIIITGSSATDTNDPFSAASSIDAWAGQSNWDTSHGAVSASLGEGTSVTICNNGTIYAAFIADDDLWFCTTSISDWENADCVEIDGSASFSPDIACSEVGNPYILYMTSSTGDIVLSNRTDGGAWEVRTTKISTRRYPAIADSMFTTSNRMNDVLHFVSNDASSDLYYNNFSIQVAPVIVYNLTITNPTTAVPFTGVVSGQTLEIDFNLTKYIDGVFDSLVTSGVTMENVTVDGTDCKINTTPVYGTPTFVAAGAIDFDTDGNGVEPVCPAHIAGDILIVSGLYRASSAGQSTSTSGWTEFEDTAGTNDFAYFWARATSPTVPGTILVTRSGGLADHYGICYVFRGATSTGTPLEDVTVTNTNSDDTPDTSTIDTTGDNRLVVSLLSFEPDSTIANDPPAGWTLDDDSASTQGADARFAIYSKEEASATTISAIKIGDTSTVVDWATLTFALFPTPVLQQFAYSPTKEVWEVNCSAPTKGDGTYDLFLNATYGGSTYNNTQIDAVTYGGEAADTCDCPADGDWNVDCSDNCEISSECDMQGNNIYITGTGSFTTSARIFNFNDLRIQGTDATNRCHVRCDSACFDSQ